MLSSSPEGTGHDERETDANAVPRDGRIIWIAYTVVSGDVVFLRGFLGSCRPCGGLGCRPTRGRATLYDSLRSGCGSAAFAASYILLANSAIPRPLTAEMPSTGRLMASLSFCTTACDSVRSIL